MRYESYVAGSHHDQIGNAQSRDHARAIIIYCSLECILKDCFANNDIVITIGILVTLQGESVTYIIPDDIGLDRLDIGGLFENSIVERN